MRAKVKETEQHRKTIRRIVLRYRKVLRELKVPRSDIPDAGQATLCLRAAHESNNLNIEKLLEFPQSDFGHDVGGILKFAPPPTGYLDGSKFWPRCGARK